MQHSSSKMGRGARAKLLDPPRSNSANPSQDMFDSIGFGMLRDSDTMSISSSGTSPSRFEDTSPPIGFSSMGSLSVGLQYPVGLVPPVSPSAPFSQMNLGDSLISPMIPTFNLGAMVEGDEDFISDGMMFPELYSDNG